MTAILKTNSEVIADYISMAPLALALERSVECRVLNDQIFERPVLDIGCGEGLFAQILFEGQVDTGIDPNARELSRARELGAYHELIQCYGDRVPKPDGSYHTIISNSVMEHIPDINSVFAEAHRLLAPGGRMYLTVPSDRFEKYTWVSIFLSLLHLKKLQERFTTFFNKFWVHYHCYTPERWGKIAKNAGFEIVEIRSYAPRRLCLINDLLVVFCIPEFLTKKLVNRWTLLPSMRRFLLAPIIFLAGVVLNGADRCDRGGLVFLSLKKVD